jgi:hypothetical protein
MRKAAGILTIVGGIIGASFWQAFIPMVIPILIGLIAIWGGICALRRKSWGWALIGAICSLLLPFFGIPALILLIMRIGEFSNKEGYHELLVRTGSHTRERELEQIPDEKQEEDMDWDSFTRETSTADLIAFNTKRNVEATKKKCPHCGQSLHGAALKCSRCERWVPNELFDRLCDEDVQLIKDNNLTVFAPSLMAIMVFDDLKDSNFTKDIQKTLGRGLSGDEQFKVLVFQSFCQYNAIHLHAQMKRGFGSGGLSFRYEIEKQLKVALLNGIIKSMRWTVSGLDYEKETRIYRLTGEVLYDLFKDICEDLGTDTAAQTRNTIALASAVYGDSQANIFNGQPLYGEVMATSVGFREIYRDMFLVEEKDFDWQAMIGDSSSS